MNLPTRVECIRMLEKENTPGIIMRHILLIEKISVFLAKKLWEKGIAVNIELVSRGALLHDLKKWDEIQGNKKGSHGIDAYEELKNRYPEVAMIVKNHMLHMIKQGLDTWEEKLVHYADRRVNHDYMVSLDERFEYFRTRYPTKDEKERQEIYMLTKKLEDEIFEKLDFAPDELKGLVLKENS